MKHVLMGYRALDFKSTDGGQVVGTQLFTAFASNGVSGQETTKLFVNPSMVPKNLDDYLGVELDVEFNQKGRVVQIDFPKPVSVTDPVSGSASPRK